MAGYNTYDSLLEYATNMRLVMHMLSLLTFTVLSLVPVAQSSRTSADSPAEQYVRQANEEEVQAFLRNDAKTMERLWSAQAARLHFRRNYHLLRLHAGGGHGERSRCGLLPLSGLS